MLKIARFTVRRLLAQVLLISICAWFIPAPGAMAAVTPAISAGGGHTVALKADGTVWAWGLNNYGQLGDGTTTYQRYAPVQVMGLTDVTAIAAGGYHTVALKADGTVWAWGNNGPGQLGDGTTINRYAPVQVPGLTGVIAIAAGRTHTVALKADGTVWAWGGNTYGQVGDGSTTDRYSPVQVPGLTGVTKIGTGAVAFHTFAFKQDGTLWAWGRNEYGQVGDGTTTQRLTPVQVQSITGASDVATGYFHTVVRKTDGTVWAWGLNANGQLGDGTTTNRLTPVQTQSLTGVSAVGAGLYYTVARKPDGTVWVWGINDYGQLGDGTTTMRYTPVQVPGLTSAATTAGYYHTVALNADGSVWTWGYNGYGQLGDGTFTAQSTPVQVPNFNLGAVTAPPSPGDLSGDTSVSIVAGALALSRASLSLSNLGTLDLAKTQTATGSETLTVTDNRGSGAGWKLKVKATNFVASQVPDPSAAGATLTVTLPVDQVLMVQGAPAVMLQGEPADTLVVEAASNTPVTSLGTSLLRADGGYGMGIYNETATYTFTVPKTVAPANIVSTNTTTSRFKPGHTVASGIFAGTYITTITYTLENAP